MLLCQSSELARSSTAVAGNAASRTRLAPVANGFHGTAGACAMGHVQSPAPMQPVPVRMAAPHVPTQHTAASSRRVRQVMASSQTQAATSLKYAQPDLVLEGHGFAHRILVFGIEHTSPQPHIGAPRSCLVNNTRPVQPGTACRSRCRCRGAATLHTRLASHHASATASRLLCFSTSPH